MTPTRLRECLALLHWSQRGLADVLSYSEGTVRGWARGVRDIPSEVAEWLELLALVHEAHPVPAGWSRTAEPIVRQPPGPVPVKPERAASLGRGIQP